MRHAASGRHRQHVWNCDVNGKVFDGDDRRRLVEIRRQTIVVGLHVAVTRDLYMCLGARVCVSESERRCLRASPAGVATDRTRVGQTVVDF